MEQGGLDQYRNEATIFRQYLGKLDESIGGHCQVKGMQERDSSGVTSKAWRIILRPVQNPDQVSLAGIFDLDDTLIPYSERKDRFYASIIEMLPEGRKEMEPNVLKVFRAINKASRILPDGGTHPEHYAPRLELMALTSFFASIRKGGMPETLKKIKEDSSSGDDERVAREFIKSEILGSFNGVVVVESQQKDNALKDYFVEKTNQSVSINPDEKPDGVDDQIWVKYHDFMMNSKIPDSEFANFDLTDNVRFIVATFGEASFQLEKITAAITELKARGRRTPDELIIFLRGRKEPVIRKIVESYPKAKFVYVDDSPRQVDKVKGMERVTPVHAVRARSKRSGEKAHPDVKVVDLATTKLSEIVSQNL